MEAFGHAMKHPQADYLASADYDAIESALLGTAKGKWFLRAYLERNRQPETLTMLNAVSRLHTVLVGDESTPPAEARRDIRMLLDTVSRTKRAASALDDEAKAVAHRELLDHVEAQLLAMSESMDEAASYGMAFSDAWAKSVCPAAGERTAKLFGELSAMVAGDEADAAYDC
jgi:hypothetical protein